MVDTEAPAFESWREVFEAHGCSLPFDVWAATIGTSGGELDPCAHLRSQLGRPIDRETIRARRWQRKVELAALQPLLPGVLDYVSDASSLDLRLAVASSSLRPWVTDHLTRLGIVQYFDRIVSRDDVQRVRPYPQLYRAALAALGLPSHRAIAFKDSPDGITASRAAGIFCVAVPNSLTCQLPTGHADLRLPSLAAIPLSALLTHVEQRK